MEYVDENELVIQMVKKNIVGKGPKYPSTGPKCSYSESEKIKKLLATYRDLRLDAFITNQILFYLSKSDIINAITII